MPQQVPYINFRLRRDFVKFLEESRKKLNRLDFQGKALEVDAIHIEQNVITERLKPLPISISEDGQERRSEDKRTAIELTGQAKLYELSRDFSNREKTSWSDAVSKRDLRLAIIGAPGSGKSFTSRYSVIEKIDEALYQINSRNRPLENIEIPLWITAKQLVSQNTEKPSIALETMVRESMANFGLSETFYRFLRKKLDIAFGHEYAENSNSAEKHFFLVVDSLDEIPKTDSKLFKKITERLDRPTIRLIVTCRTLQWDSRIGWLGFTPQEKVEVAPLNLVQQQEFSKRFFNRRPKLQASLKNLLDANYALRHAFTTPLLLTLGCLLHSERDGDQVLDKSTTYVEIYGLVIGKMFCGVWRDDEHKPDWADDPVSQSQLLSLLDNICWELFRKNPEVNLLTCDDWTKAFKASKSAASGNRIKADVFLRELLKLGFILDAGFDKQALPQWSFVHRTFLEFLAARALANRVDWLEIAKVHFWFAPEWIECLTFLAGLLDVPNVRKLIGRVRDQEDDIFGSMIFLEAKFTGASRMSEITDIQSICDLVILGLAETSRADRFLTLDVDAEKRTISSENIELSSIVLDLNNQSRNYVFSKLIEPILLSVDNMNNDVWWNLDYLPAEILGSIGQASNKVIDFLIKIVVDENNHWDSPRNAIEALGKIGDTSDKFIDVLVKVVANENNELPLRCRAAEALGNIGKKSDAVIEVLLKEVADENNNDEWLRSYAAEALGNIGKISDAGIEVLLRVVANENNHIWLRRYAAEALAKVGNASDEIIDLLIKVVADENNDEWLRCYVAGALIKIGKASDEIIDFLIKIVVKQNTHFRGRVWAMKALSNIGNPSDKVVDVLKSVVANAQNIREMRYDAAIALANISIISNEVIEDLIEDALDGSLLGHFRRKYAVEVLGRLYSNGGSIKQQILSKVEKSTIPRNGYLLDTAVASFYQYFQTNRIKACWNEASVVILLQCD